MASTRGELSESAREQLQVIYDLLRQRNAWPTFRTVDLRFDRYLGIDDAQAALSEIPPQYLQRSWHSHGFHDSDEVRLSLWGIRACDGGHQDLLLLSKFVEWGSRLERTKDLDDESDLVLSSINFASNVGLDVGSAAENISDPERPSYEPGITSTSKRTNEYIDSFIEENRGRLARLRLLVDLLPHFWTGMGWKEPWHWQLTIDSRRFRPYRNIHNVDQLLSYADQVRREQSQRQPSFSEYISDSDAITAAEEEEVTELPVELDSVGKSTGVERETTSDELIEEPFDPEKIDVTTRTPTVSLLLARIGRGVLDLQPEFQRMAGIWSEMNQSRLIESMLLRIPLPTFYAAEADDDDWIIVDGVQRLTTIARFIDPHSVDAWETPLVLRNLEYLSQYENKRFTDLPGRLQTRLLETELVLHLIRLGTPEPVMFNIFARINTGGRPLTRQELRHALIPGSARELLRELAYSEPYLRATLGTVSPERMDDREMVLRFIAFRLTDPEDYRPDIDDFLRLAMRRINQLSLDQISRLTQDFYRSMEAAHDIFGIYAFRKHYPGQQRRSPINKALFEATSVNLAWCSDRELEILRRRRQFVVEVFSDLLVNRPDFDRAISVGTGDAAKVRLRFSVVGDMIKDIAND